ncbi:MAG TPA: primosomal protein N' [Bacteroidales bacterium]|nr:primosomal protein N' [Bacteroidales bacterium]
MPEKYADVILPVPVKGRFTYVIPGSLEAVVRRGVRVNVPFGRNVLAGIVMKVHDNAPESQGIKKIISITEAFPASHEYQLALWEWMADYYMCHEGEVMKAALPSEKSITGYKLHYETFISLSENFTEKKLNAILDSLKKASKQQDVLTVFLSLTGYQDGCGSCTISKSDLLSRSHSSPAAIKALVGKGILREMQIALSRIDTGSVKTEPVHPLTEAQENALQAVRMKLKESGVVLLHGITSSGKTEIYIHLIEEQLKQGKQVLYLLPEIALTTQIIMRLKQHFGGVTGVYHSKLNDNEKLEVWRNVASGTGFRLILGVRSSLFMPFSNLGLVIVDEEHDSSYKQQDPAPRYHARDSAIMLARLHGAGTVLGSASPSVESYFNVISGKYGLVELTERYGKVKLPDIVLANTREAYKRKLMVSHFTPELLYSIDEALGNEEQVILFQNRRGFSPYIECPECGWVPKCVQCAVNLTYHKSINKLVCHYCGFMESVPHKCDNCSSTGLETRGFGTEKIEDEIKIVFPRARVARMDQDTTRGRNAFDRILRSFSQKQIDILIGTQMISKGLDFENLTVVGVLNADNLLNFPDFRAHERSFQMLEQVSGRAGRRQKQGKVIIQTSDPSHRIIRLVTRHDFKNMFRYQAEERKAFNYPPFCRMISLSVKHKDRARLNYFADLLAAELRNSFGSRVLGPEAPVIYRIQLWYIKTIILKIERDKSSSKAKQIIRGAVEKTEKEKGASSLRIVVDVDPY